MEPRSGREPRSRTYLTRTLILPLFLFEPGGRPFKTAGIFNFRGLPRTMEIPGVHSFSRPFSAALFATRLSPDPLDDGGRNGFSGAPLSGVGIRDFSTGVSLVSRF